MDRLLDPGTPVVVGLDEDHLRALHQAVQRGIADQHQALFTALAIEHAVNSPEFQGRFGTFGLEHLLDLIEGV